MTHPTVEILSTQDATLWWVQGLDTPLHIGALAFFDGGPLREPDGRIRIDAIRARIGAQLEHTPRFRQRLVELPLGQGLAWIDDDHFDLAHHVRLTALPRPGGDRELRDLVTDLLETPPDPTRPLWEIWVVDGLADGRVVLLPKVNHVMADGTALLDFSIRMFDPGTDAGSTAPGEAATIWDPEPAPAPASLLARGLAERSRRQVGALWQFAASATDPAVLSGLARSVVGLGGSGSGVAPSLPVTKPVGPRRDVVWLKLPWDDLERVKRAQGTTLNDVVLAVTAGALAYYLEHSRPDTPTDTPTDVDTDLDRDAPGAPPGDGSGDAATGPAPRVLVPVSTHGRTVSGEFENRFSMMVVDLPIAEHDPLVRLRTIHAEMDRHKASGQTKLGPLLFSLADLVPPWLLRTAAPPVLRNQPVVNLCVSNMPGSRDPLHLLGARLTDLYPYICGVGNIAVIIGVISYLDALGVGLTVDADVVPDPDLLATGLRLAAAELVAAVDEAADPAGDQARDQAARARRSRRAT
ncbi:MAG TPA: wax ester/triacylglycerol synthase family O-acyltransferase [Acidimicrobiales bacterium]|nr:wax ester/triacylglycerol synthase family O-acyltransferase [Acidimicrobiales bacterium]